MGSPVNGPSTSLGEALETWNHLVWCDHLAQHSESLSHWEWVNSSSPDDSRLFSASANNYTPPMFASTNPVFPSSSFAAPIIFPQIPSWWNWHKNPENSQKLLGWSHETRKLGWKHMIELSFLCRNSTPTSLAYLIIGVYVYIYIYANPFGSGSCAYWEWVFENQLSKRHLIMLSCSSGGAVAAPTYGSVFHFRSHLESLNLGGRLCLCNTAGQVKPQINWELIECKFKFPSPFRS